MKFLKTFGVVLVWNLIDLMKVPQSTLWEEKKKTWGQTLATGAFGTKIPDSLVFFSRRNAQTTEPTIARAELMCDI